MGKLCEWCSEHPVNRGGRFCCEQCKVDERNKRRKDARRDAVDFNPNRVCPMCGESFMVDFANRNKKYDKPECKERAKSRRKTKRRRGEAVPAYVPPTTFQEKTCEICGTKYRGEPASLYCSRACLDASREAVATIVCVACGSEVLRVGAYSAACCSHDCYVDTYVRTCCECGGTFDAVRIDQVTCGKGECIKSYGNKKNLEWYYNNFQSAANPHMCKCVDCGKEILAKTAAGRLRCKRCSRRAHKGVNQTHIGRAKRYGVKYKYFNELKVLERDGWVCYLCGRDTPKALRGTYQDNAPELDHVVPLSRGGVHLPRNVRCSCRRCNGLKSNMTADEFWDKYGKGGVNRCSRSGLDRVGGSAPATMILDIGG